MSVTAADMINKIGLLICLFFSLKHPGHFQDLVTKPNIEES